MKCAYLLALFSFLLAAHEDLKLPIESQKSFQELLKEQRFDEAISNYLQFLGNQKKNEQRVPESLEFKEAYLIYLNLQGKPSRENAAFLLEKYGESTEDPNLAYILAASYANLGRFDQFFLLYLQGYQNNPDHYLADKMIAVLHIKLFERLLPGNQKEEERAKIIEYLQKAIAKNPSDHMLYKMQLAFFPEKDKKVHVENLISIMICEKVVYPRADLQFYVRMAMMAKGRELAERFIEYSRSIFGYSRSLEAALKNLDSKE